MFLLHLPFILANLLFLCQRSHILPTMPYGIPFLGMETHTGSGGKRICAVVPQMQTINVNLLNFREGIYFLVSALALRVSYYHCTVFLLMVTTSRKLFSVPLPLLK